MSITTVLMKALAAPLAKLLVRRYLADPAEAVGEGLLDVVQRRIEDYAEQREAQRQFERLGERIVARLVPLFEHETRNADISIEAVGAEIAQTLGGRVSAEFFLARDLDPARLASVLRAARPVHTGPFSAAEIALYDRALDESVRYVVQVASRLPKFEEAYAAESLRRLGRMSEDLEEVLDTTRRIEQAVTQLSVKGSEADALFARYEADYRQAVMRNLDYLELFGADVTQESRRHALSVAYISLNLRRPAGNPDEAESLSVEAVLDSLSPAEGRLLIRGEAGSGKSTLSRWTAIQAASFDPALFTFGHSVASRVIGAIIAATAFQIKRPSAPTETVETHAFDRGRDVLGGVTSRARAREEPLSIADHWRFRVPFLLRLRDCKDGQLPRPDEFPTHIAGEIGNPPPDWVASILRQGKALVLLDGIDEVPNMHREQLRRAIKSIVNAWPNNYFLASTRPTAVEEGWLTGAGFREATVDPLSDVDRTLFIEKWHDAVGRELILLGIPDPTLPQIASELVEQLPEHPPVARLATNPLLCAMICALHRERSQKLPESQAELCEAICHMLLHRRERESGLAMDAFPEVYRTLTYPEKRAIVQDIAHYMVRNGESTISWVRAQQSVDDSLKQFSDRKKIDPKELLKLLIERSGVLRETRPGEIDFIHNTLKEYLAAERFTYAEDVGQLADRYEDASWQPVILFAVATNQREFATKVVRRILHPQDHNTDLASDDLRARRLFALRCRAAALHLSPELIAELESIEGSLFPPHSMADAEALASGGDAAVNYLRSRKRLSARQAAACVRTLRLIGTRKAEKALRGYINDSRMTVVSELAQALNALEIALVRNMLLRDEIIPEALLARITNLEPLRGLNLEALNISNTQVADLGPLTESTRLRSLSISETQVSDLTPLAKLTNLQSLTLWGTETSDLTPLANLAGLQYLDLMITPVSDISPLAGLMNLQSLDLWGTDVNDIAPLMGLLHLESLNLRRSQVRDLRSLASLATLEWLNVAETQVSDFSPLAGLPGLKSLDLHQTLVNDLSPFAGLTYLESLYLSETQVEDLTPLAGLTHLESLYLSGTPVRDLTPLVGLRRLHSLDLGREVSDLSPLVGLNLKNLFVSNDIDVSVLSGNSDLKIIRV